MKFAATEKVRAVPSPESGFRGTIRNMLNAQRRGFVLVAIGALFLLEGCSHAPRNPWAEAKLPLAGPVQVIGGYAAGCLAGADALPPQGRGYQMMRLSRGKYYGHPALLRFISELGAKVAAKGHGQVLVGNLGQARGGPTLVGHKSHQIGLDVDFWYWQPPREKGRKAPRVLTLYERERLESPSVIKAGVHEINPAVWTVDMVALLRLSSEHPNVERIFVNPVIKKELCSKFGGQTWLSKLRPWWGHDDHFHVRLKCPADQPACVAQEPVAPGDGCDKDLEWWFSEEALKQAREMDKEPAKPVMPKLPEACDRVLGG